MKLESGSKRSSGTSSHLIQPPPNNHHSLAYSHSHSHPKYHKTIRHLPLFNYTAQQPSLTQWLVHLWILSTFLIAGSESGEGSSSSSSSQLSTDEVLGTAEARGPLACKFPAHWAGSWFQSGVHQTITITQSTINTKGKCLEVDGEKYLVYQPRSNCYKCLVFSEKHMNVLQYKESFCIPERRTLPSICATISGDFSLYAMFRLDPEPIDCPLQGPFTFSYDRGSGECRYPESSVYSCAHSSRLLFNYQACPDVPKTESVEEQVQCIASWKEGSTRYFLGLLQYSHHASSSYEDRFRCYAYEYISSSSSGNGGPSNLASMRRGEVLNSHNLHHHHPHHQYPQTLALGRSRPKPYQGVAMMNSFNTTNGSGPHTLPSVAEIRVSQSGDATCQGLEGMEGKTMYLRKVQQAETENCLFPSWIQTHPQWHTLDQSSIYEFDSDQFRVTNNTQEQTLSATDGTDSLAKSGSCIKVLEDEPGHRAVITVHARAGCKIAYQCLVIHKRDADIMELQFGEWSRKHEEACRFYFDSYRQPFITLISSTPKSAQCPAIGQFSLSLPPDQEFRFHSNNIFSLNSASNLLQHQCKTNGTLRMGCSSLDSLQLEISSECHDSNQPRLLSDSSGEQQQQKQQSHNSPSFREVTDYNCHGWWEEDGITYMIATLYSSSSTKLRGKRHCFVIRDSSIESPQQWIHSKESQEARARGQMSLFRHSNGDGDDDDAAAGQRSRSGSQMFDTDSNVETSSAALFFFNNNNNNNHGAAGKILEISTFADSCRRHVEGDFSAKATKIGHCFASSSSPSLTGIQGGIMMMMAMAGMMTTSLCL